MKIINPKKLKIGDKIRIIAPSKSMTMISKETREIADKRFFDMGFKLSFGKNVEENDYFNSSSIKSRVQDIHDAFSDKNVKGVLTAIGGFNTNQLLEYIDWKIIENNPKIFCGFSDITILNNAIFQKAGLITFYGPHYSTFGQKLYFDYTLDYFKKCLMENNSFKIFPSKQWSDDKWYGNQEKRNLIRNKGWTVINEGKAEGIVIGGNIGTFNLLQGTEYFPKVKKLILFIEDDDLPRDSSAMEFDRALQSIIQQLYLDKISGIVIGRFQKESNMTVEIIKQIIKTKKELSNIPILFDVDFGHTDPKITFPIGGKVKIIAKNKASKIEFMNRSF
jgi:muramoyltetrapeptide carboxypeptidase LdcA involved in peptidoglycan recycling